MNIGTLKLFLSVLKSTENILRVTKQSKALLYIDNTYPDKGDADIDAHSDDAETMAQRR